MHNINVFSLPLNMSAYVSVKKISQLGVIAVWFQLCMYLCVCARMGAVCVPVVHLLVFLCVCVSERMREVCSK